MCRCITNKESKHFITHLITNRSRLTLVRQFILIQYEYQNIISADANENENENENDNENEIQNIAEPEAIDDQDTVMVATENDDENTTTNETDPPIANPTQVSV